MTGRIFAVKRFAVHDGDGVRTTLFLKGCPLRCRWCHNPEGLAGVKQLAFYAHKCVGCGICASLCPEGAQTLSPRRIDRARCRLCGKCVSECPESAMELFGETVTPESLLPKLTEDRDFYRESGGGVTLSGGECLLQPSFCAELLRLLKDEDISTAVDTCGFVPWENFEAVLPNTDLFLYGTKAIDENTHLRGTGSSNAQILENLQRLCRAGAEIEVRVPFVPGFTDGEIPAIGAFLQSCGSIRGVRVLPYHDYARTKYAALGLPDTLPEILPTAEAVKAAREALRDFGLNVIEA